MKKNNEIKSKLLNILSSENTVNLSITLMYYALSILGPTRFGKIVFNSNRILNAGIIGYITERGLWFKNQLLSYSPFKVLAEKSDEAIVNPIISNLSSNGAGGGLPGKLLLGVLPEDTFFYGVTICLITGITAYCFFMAYKTLNLTIPDPMIFFEYGKNLKNVYANMKKYEPGIGDSLLTKEQILNYGSAIKTAVGQDTLKGVVKFLGEFGLLSIASTSLSFLSGPEGDIKVEDLPRKLNVEYNGQKFAIYVLEKNFNSVFDKLVEIDTVVVSFSELTAGDYAEIKKLGYEVADELLTPVVNVSNDNSINNNSLDLIDDTDEIPLVVKKKVSSSVNNQNSINNSESVIVSNSNELIEKIKLEVKNKIDNLFKEKGFLSSTAEKITNLNKEINYSELPVHIQIFAQGFVFDYYVRDPKIFKWLNNLLLSKGDLTFTEFELTTNEKLEFFATHKCSPVLKAECDALINSLLNPPVTVVPVKKEETYEDLFWNLLNFCKEKITNLFKYIVGLLWF